MPAQSSKRAEKQAAIPSRLRALTGVVVAIGGLASFGAYYLFGEQIFRDSGSDNFFKIAAGIGVCLGAYFVYLIRKRGV